MHNARNVSDERDLSAAWNKGERLTLNLSKLYGKNIVPSCKCCFYYVETTASGEQSEKKICEKGKDLSSCTSCGAFRYEPTLRQPKEQPLLKDFSPEDFKI